MFLFYRCLSIASSNRHLSESTRRSRVTFEETILGVPLRSFGLDQVALQMIGCAFSLSRSQKSEMCTNVYALQGAILPLLNLQLNQSGLMKEYYSLSLIEKWFLEFSQMEAEFARPLWVFGMNSYEILKEHRNLIAYRQKGRSYLGVVDKNKNTLSILQTPFTYLMNIASGVRCLYVEGASRVHPFSIAKVTLDDVPSTKWPIASVQKKIATYKSIMKELPVDNP